MATEMSLRVGSRIRQRREELGIRTQRELADRIPSPSVTNQTINKWEQGVNEPGAKYKAMLAEALQVDVAYFIAEEVKGATPSPFAGTDALADRLDALEARVTEQLEEHARRVEMLLAAQDALLQRQSEILERIENAIAREDGVRDEIAELIDRAGREIVQGAPQAAVRDRQPAPPLRGDATN